MERIRRGNDDRIDGGIRQHVYVVGIGARGLVDACHSFHQIHRDVADRVKIGVTRLDTTFEVSGLSDRTTPKDTDLQSTFVLRRHRVPFRSQPRRSASWPGCLRTTVSTIEKNEYLFFRTMPFFSFSQHQIEKSLRQGCAGTFLRMTHKNPLAGNPPQLTARPVSLRRWRPARQPGVLSGVSAGSLYHYRIPSRCWHSLQNLLVQRASPAAQQHGPPQRGRPGRWWDLQSGQAQGRPNLDHRKHGRTHRRRNFQRRRQRHAAARSAHKQRVQ